MRPHTGVCLPRRGRRHAAREAWLAGLSAETGPTVLVRDRSTDDRAHQGGEKTGE
ncbi:hypothetical protein ACWDAO_36480 [Streptomyces sp. NPDC001212]